MEQQTKICSKCGIEKPLSEFHSNKWHKDGHTTQCKKCVNGGMKLKRKTDPQFVLRDAARGKLWREKNYDYHIAYHRKYWHDHYISEKQNDKCLICGKSLPQIKTKYCSIECKKIGFAKNKRKRSGVPEYSDCKLCGKSFRPLQKTHFYCSYECLLKSRNVEEGKIQYIIEYKPKRKENARKQSERLDDSAIVKMIRHCIPELTSEKIYNNPDLIEAKRYSIKLKRISKQLKQKQNATS